MKTTSLSSVALMVVTVQLYAQSLPPADAAGRAVSAGFLAKDEAIVLTPFEVVADARDTYDATNTNSVTGTNTPLSKTPLDAKVFNRQLMDELDVVDMTDMLSKIGGLGSPVIGTGAEIRGDLEGDRQDPKTMTMRGLAISNPRRDGFLRSDTTLLDSFDVERVEAIGGSNSLLFGSGDAGGIITSTSKRAWLNRRPTATFTMKADSEGSWRATLDAQAGNRLFAVRVNGVKGDTHFFRPAHRQQNAGVHVAATVQPWKRLTIRGEYRYFTRDSIFTQAMTVRAPLTWKLPSVDPLGRPIVGATALNVDNKSSRYLGAFPEIAEFTHNGPFDLTTVDSGTGPFTCDAYTNQIRSIVAESVLTSNLALQLRYGHDARVNDPLRASSVVAYAPGATGNNYVDPATGEVGTRWAFNTGLTAQPVWTGARGYRAALAYTKDFKRWGRHQASAFYQDMDSWSNTHPWGFYEADPNGGFVQNLSQITNAISGRTEMPAVWLPIFPTQVIGGRAWPFTSLTHPNGKTYRYSSAVYSDAVPKTPGNPMGYTGPVDATGATTANVRLDDTRERSVGASVFSEWWGGRIDTMAGYRAEEASTLRVNTGAALGPISYDSLTTGVVIDTPIKGLRLSGNYATNAKINFDTGRDIFDQPLPVGEGESKDIGLKFDLWERRVSGNLNYYISKGKNFIGSLGAARDDIDPDGINGRHGGSAYTYDKTSDGLNLTLTSRPLRGWELRVNFATADGSERSNVVLPQFYNDQFNTTTVGGQTVVGVRASASAAVAPLLVASDPRDPASAKIPLSVAMMRDPTSAYFATLDPDSGRILNAQTLGLRTAGVGTNETGLSINEHQLGFVSPTGGVIVVKQAGEQTVNYAERSYSVINRFQFNEGRLRGLVLGLSTSLRDNHRAYMYNDAADGGKRKMYYFPDRLLNDVFAVYHFRPTQRVNVALQLNITNVLDANRVLYLVNTANGTLRYAQWFNAPRKYSLTTSCTF